MSDTTGMSDGTGYSPSIADIANFSADNNAQVLGLTPSPTFVGVDPATGLAFSQPAQMPGYTSPGPTTTEMARALASMSAMVYAAVKDDAVFTALGAVNAAIALSPAMDITPAAYPGVTDDVNHMVDGVTAGGIAAYSGNQGATFGNDFGGANYGSGPDADPNSGLGGLY